MIVYLCLAAEANIVEQNLDLSSKIAENKEYIVKENTIAEGVIELKVEDVSDGGTDEEDILKKTSLAEEANNCIIRG